MRRGNVRSRSVPGDLQRAACTLRGRPSWAATPRVRRMPDGPHRGGTVLARPWCDPRSPTHRTGHRFLAGRAWASPCARPEPASPEPQCRCFRYLATPGDPTCRRSQRRTCAGRRSASPETHHGAVPDDRRPSRTDRAGSTRCEGTRSRRSNDHRRCRCRRRWRRHVPSARTPSTHTGAARRRETPWLPPAPTTRRTPWPDRSCRTTPPPRHRATTAQARR